jgi:hypothetical protein
VDKQVENVQNSLRRIKMKTNYSTDRSIDDGQVVEPQVEATVEEPSTTPDASVATAEGSEEIKPLSPQFAALAKQRRALQVKEQQLIEREKALSTQGQSPDAIIQKLKSEPLSVLKEHGVTYDQLTEAILNEQNGISPEVTKLRAEIEAMKADLNKNFTDRDQQQEEAALREMQREATFLAKDGETYEMIRDTNSIPDVMELIKRTYKTTGEVLDVSVAMEAIETELLEESLQAAQRRKVQERLKVGVQPQPGQKLIKTLTNRDSAAPILDRRSRAIAAMNGTLKR